TEVPRHKDQRSEIQPGGIAHHLCQARSASRRVACQLATRAKECRFLAVRPGLLAESRGSQRVWTPQPVKRAEVQSVVSKGALSAFQEQLSRLLNSRARIVGQLRL